MSKLNQQITALREALHSADVAQSDSFSEVFSSFLEIAETTELMDASKPFKDNAMRTLLEQVVREFGQDPELTLAQTQILHHSAGGLVHGIVAAGRHMGTFFYFLKEQQGIVAFAGGGSMMHYVRMTATQLPPGMVIGRKRWSTKGLRN